MSMLKIGTLTVDLEQLGDFEQTYDDLVNATFARTADNSGIIRVTGAAKVRTLIRARGWAPPGFVHLARGTSYVLACAMVRAIDSTITTVTLPAGRRADTDYEPRGFAFVDGRSQSTPITNLAAILAGSTDDATLDAVAGASGYRVHYWPQLTAVILRAETTGAGSANFGWQLEAEEL